MRRWVCSLELLLALASAISLRPKVPRGSLPRFTVWNSRFSQPGRPSPRIYNPWNRVAQLHLPALRSLLVVSYNSTPTDSWTTSIDSRWTYKKHVRWLVMDAYCCPEHESTGPLPSNGCPFIVELLLRGNSFTGLLLSIGHMRHNTNRPCCQNSDYSVQPMDSKSWIGKDMMEALVV
jgi:hypothetical protein